MHACSLFTVHFKSTTREIGFYQAQALFHAPATFLLLKSAPVWKCGSHLLRGISKYSLATLNLIQKRVIRLIDNTTPHPSPLEYSFPRFPCIINTVINPISNARFARNTRFTDPQYPFAVKFEKCRTTSFANTFVPMTSRN